jgi:hypothetical protein
VKSRPAKSAGKRGPRALMPNPLEREFQSQVLRLAVLCGWRFYHTHDARRSPPGFPDLVLKRRRGDRVRVVFAELKREGERPTPVQAEWLADLRDAGFDARLWRPSDWQEIQDVLTGADE